MDGVSNEVSRAELLGMTPTGDLLDLARQMREMGVESLLFARPDGRITGIMSDRQIAHLANRETLPVPDLNRWAEPPAAPISPVKTPSAVNGMAGANGKPAANGRPGVNGKPPTSEVPPVLPVQATEAVLPESEGIGSQPG